MNALGSLAAGIAHDFNNILSIIKGSAQIIEDNADKPDKIRTRVDRIKTVVQQGAEVVDAMLGFSRSTDQPPAPCDLNAVVDETRKLLGDRFLRETEVRFERGENLPEVSVAKDFVQQILLNFIFNAAEAMDRRLPVSNECVTNPSPGLPATLSPSDGERDGVRGALGNPVLPREIFICGGAQIYALALPLCSDLYLTLVKHEVAGDAFFPPFEGEFGLAAEIRDTPDFKILHYRRPA